MSNSWKKLKPGVRYKLTEDVGVVIEDNLAQETPEEKYERMKNKYPDKNIIHIETIVQASNPMERLNQMIQEQDIELTNECYNKLIKYVEKVVEKRKNNK